MPSYPSKPKTLAGDPGLATEGETLRLRSGRDPSASLRAGSFGSLRTGCRRYSVFSRYGGFSQAVKALADTIAMQN
jgi:hypothetical protein